MIQKQYSLTDFSLISTEEPIDDINEIFAVKKDPQGNILEYYANIPDPSLYSSNKKLEELFTYFRENEYVDGEIGRAHV